MIPRSTGAARGWALVLLSASAAKAEPPSLEGLFPAGGSPGSEFTVEASGKNETWPAAVWTNGNGISFEPVADKKGQWTARITADCAPGVHLLLAHHAGGASAARQFVVADAMSGGELRELEPNQHYKEAQRVAFSGDFPAAVVNGILEASGDVDCFAVKMEKGQWLVAEAACYRLDAPADPLLHVRDANGNRLAFNHDKEGPALDPRLAFQAPDAGVYVVELAAFAYPPKADIRLTGSREAVYRLRLSLASEVLSVFPTGLRIGQTNRFELTGWNLPEPAVTLSAGENPSSLQMPGWMRREGLPLAIGGAAEFIEDATAENSQHLGTPPVNLSGRIEAAGDMDTYILSARKGEALNIQARTWEFGSMLDPVLQILSSEGKELASADDIGTLRPEAKLTWSAPEDGDVQIRIRSRFPGEGAPDRIYRLEIAPLAPALNLTVAADRFEIAAGGELELKVTAARNQGYAKPATLRAEGLPPGITAAPVQIPEKGGEIALKFLAAVNATTAGPFRIVSDDGTAAAFALKGSYAEAGDLFVNEVQDLWLTVTPPKEAPKEAATGTGGR